MILAALAAGAGLARGVAGIAQAGSQGRANRDLIKRAYQISKRRTNESQAYTRQGANESLNARGVLNGGANTSRSATVADAYSQGAKSAAQNKAFTDAKTVGDKLKAMNGVNGADRLYGTEAQRMAHDAEAGQSGDASTLSGQVNSDMSREFYGEHQDLYAQRQQAIEQTKRDQSAATVNAIGSGIDVGTSVYNAGQMIQGALGSKAAIPSTAGTGTQPQIVKPGNWFGGYDPVDPLGLSKRKITNDQFNVHSQGG